MRCPSGAKAWRETTVFGRLGSTSAWLLATLLLAAAGPAGAEQRVPVALELVIAIDVSASVDPREYALQIDGVANAFRHPDVIAAIESVGSEGIAVALVQWSERGRAVASVPFHHLTDGRSAKAFGFLASLAQRRHRSGLTSIGSGIEFAMQLIDASDYAGHRRLIDISGDGRANAPPFPEPLRDLAVARGFTINGLAILTDDAELTAYYRASVAGGRDAFVEVAEDYHAFGAALLRKLVRELTAPVAERRPGEPALQVAGEDLPWRSSAAHMAAGRR